ncbi:MAG: hypothetical protein CMN10_08050 [Roseobacter sp.]|nr:hypothetical protein [Roseobacter sp.]
MERRFGIGGCNLVADTCAVSEKGTFGMLGRTAEKSADRRSSRQNAALRMNVSNAKAASRRWAP